MQEKDMVNDVLCKLCQGYIRVFRSKFKANHSTNQEQ